LDEGGVPKLARLTGSPVERVCRTLIEQTERIVRVIEKTL
jgi:hypothetical protein